MLTIKKSKQQICPSGFYKNQYQEHLFDKTETKRE